VAGEIRRARSRPGWWRGRSTSFRRHRGGPPFVIEDSAGNVVARDRGVLRYTVLLDTLGDGMLGGELLEETIEVRGPHPSFAEDFPFCEIAAELTGA
jgi:hypothetical protein